MRRHLEAPEFHQAQPAGGRVGGVEFVDAELGTVGVTGDIHQQVAQDPVGQPGCCCFSGGQLLQRDLQFVEAVVARLVDPRRLGRGADEHAREKVGERRVMLPVTQQRRQHLGSTQDGTVRRGCAADGDMVAAAGAAVPAVQHEFLCAQPRQSCLLVEDLRVGDQVAPGSGRVHVDLDDARVGGHLDALEPVVVGCFVAFEHHGRTGLPGGSLDGGDEVEPVLEMGQGRQEQVQDAVAWFGAEGSADKVVRAAAFLVGALLLAHEW